MLIRTLTAFVISLALMGSLGCEGTLDMDAFDTQLVESDAQAETQMPQAKIPQTPEPTPVPAETTSVEPPQDPAPVQEPPAEEPPSVEPARPEPGTIVEFEILQGTGSGPWNAKDSAVVAYVGQILRITNLDDRPHQFHGSDNAPIDHGSKFQPGETVEVEVKRAVALGDRAQNWDHGDGRSAEFWIDSRE